MGLRGTDVAREAAAMILRDDAFSTVAAANLGVFVTAIRFFGQTTSEAVTVSFLTLAIAQLFHVFNMKADDKSIYTSSVARNRWVWGAMSFCLALLAAACYVPLLATVLGLRQPSPTDLGIVFGFALVLPVAETLRGWVGKFVRKFKP